MARVTVIFLASERHQCANLFYLMTAA